MDDNKALVYILLGLFSMAAIVFTTLAITTSNEDVEKEHTKQKYLEYQLDSLRQSALESALDYSLPHFNQNKK